MKEEGPQSCDFSQDKLEIKIKQLILLNKIQMNWKNKIYDLCNIIKYIIPKQIMNIIFLSALKHDNKILRTDTRKWMGLFDFSSSTAAQ